MKRRIPIRILSLFLAFVLVFSSCPPVYAAQVQTPEAVTEEIPMLETPATEEQEDVPEETPAEETVQPETQTVPQETEAAPPVTEPAEETVPQETASGETTEETVPEETAEETVPEETTEETVPEETTEETVPEETTEETVPEEEGFQFPGLPEDYILSDDAMARKQTLREMGTAEVLRNLTAGVDYQAGVILVEAESEEDAAVIAAAFGGEVARYWEGIARIALNGATVQEAVEASLDPEMPLPAAEANLLTRIEETPELSETGKLSYDAYNLPKEQSWQTWVYENMGNPDPYLLNPGGYEFEYQYMHDAVNTYAAWGVTIGEPWVKVGVIDTGVQADHPELAGRVTTRPVAGMSTEDVIGHGTAVAGVIAAAMDNGIGGAGIAPGVSIYSYRVINDEGTCSAADVAEAIEMAVQDGVDIINMSLGFYQYSQTMKNAVDYAAAYGVTVVAAAGNDASNIMEYPAAFDGVIGVAATDRSGDRADFSSYGSWVDVSAPGKGIYTTSIGSGEGCWDGTSFASPVVAGVAALYTSAKGYRVDPAEMEKVLEKNVTKVPSKDSGAGIVNAAKMFGGQPAAPVAFFAWDVDKDGYYDVLENVTQFKSPLPCDADLIFSESEELSLQDKFGDQGDAMIFTLDGTTPSVKNGQLVNGNVMNMEFGDLEQGVGRPWIPLSEYAGETLTIKAARMSGMGVMGKVLSLKLKILKSDAPDSIEIHGSSQVIAGKSTTYSAITYPVDTADPTVTWGISDASNYTLYTKSKIDKNGKLSTPKGTSGWVDIIAATPDGYPYTIKTVYVGNARPVKRISLRVKDHEDLNPYAFGTYIGSVGQMLVSAMFDDYGSSVDPEDIGFRWSSSNPKIVSIDPVTGEFQVLGKGSATLTCMALDGSNFKKTCKVNILQQVEQVEISGNMALPRNSSTTFKATVYPKTASNKKVRWSLDRYVPGVSIDPNSGKVTVGYATVGTEFYIVATAQDAFGETDTYPVIITNKCSSVSIGMAEDQDFGFAPGAEFKNGAISTVTLFSVDHPESVGTDNVFDLNAYADVATIVRWSSSNPQIVSVSGNGIITAHKAGSAKITAEVLDGSRKKATCTVKVVNPVSSMSVNAAQRECPMWSDSYLIACGKSAKNTITFGSAYGVPTNKKVEWDFFVSVYDQEGNEDNSRNWTYYFKQQKLITVKNGTLSVKAAVEDDLLYYDLSDYRLKHREIEVVVYADATDGTGAWAWASYYVISPTRELYMEDGNVTYYCASNQPNYGAYFWSDQWTPYGAFETFSFEATSSNPKVAGAVQIVPIDYDPYSGLTRYGVQYATGKKGTRGTATITIKATDGSNKKCSFKVKVVSDY